MVRERPRFGNGRVITVCQSCLYAHLYSYIAFPMIYMELTVPTLNFAENAKFRMGHPSKVEFIRQTGVSFALWLGKRSVPGLFGYSGLFECDARYCGTTVEGRVA